MRIEQSSQRRLQLQHRKIAARHEQALAARSLRLVSEVCAEANVRRDVRENGLDLLQVAEHGIDEDHIAVARAAAALEAGLRVGRAQVHEFRRIGNRERLQQHLMEHRKNSSGRANAERERDDGDGRDEGSSEKRADGELETAHKGVRRAKVRRRLPALA